MVSLLKSTPLSLKQFAADYEHKPIIAARVNKDFFRKTPMLNRIVPVFSGEELCP